MSAETWADQRACRDTDPGVFLPRNIGRNVYREARALCADCPVSSECLKAIMEAEGSKGPRLRFGMYAGTTPKQRAAMSGRQERTCVVCARRFVSVRVRLTCGPNCAKVRKADWAREHQRMYRYTHRPNPIPKGNRHGSVSMAHSGCQCSACTGRRRQDRRRERAKARARAEVLGVSWGERGALSTEEKQGNTPTYPQGSGRRISA